MFDRLIRVMPPLMEVAQGSFVWQDHIKQIVITALLSMVPMFEGRYAVVGMIGTGMPPVFAYVLAVISSYLPVPFILLLLRPVLDWFYTLPIKPVRRFAKWLEKRAEKKRASMRDQQKKGRHRFSQETAELIALYLFVAIPVPGTGVWMGSAIASLFNMPIFKSAITILLGNMTACLITALITTGAVAIL